MPGLKHVSNPDEEVLRRIAFAGECSDSHLDLDRAPYVLYAGKYIDLVSLVA